MVDGRARREFRTTSGDGMVLEVYDATLLWSWWHHTDTGPAKQTSYHLDSPDSALALLAQLAETVSAAPLHYKEVEG